MEKQDRDNAGKFTQGSEAARRAGQKGGKANGNRDRVDTEREAYQKSEGGKNW